MTFTLRGYQQDAKRAAVDHFRHGKGNGVAVLPTGSGKSLVIASAADELGEPLLIFQPSKEILEQNAAKLQAYGHTPAIFSASAGQKRVDRITLATIGSVDKRPELFSDFRHIMIDECHGVNARGGMYERFIRGNGAKVIGLTATPYRLVGDGFGGSMLKFLTRTRPRVFDRVIHVTQTAELFSAGHLSRLEYFPLRGSLDPSVLRTNSTGADYEERSMEEAFHRLRLYDRMVEICHRFLKSERAGLLVFTRFVREAMFVADRVPGCAVVTGETPKGERERILSEFKAKRIRIVLNVGVLTTGFDYPELDTVLLARPSLSLALYYQMVGRVMRPHPSKASAFVLDLCGNYRRFGRVEDLRLDFNGGRWIVTSRGHQLTNVPFDKYRLVA